MSRLPPLLAGGSLVPYMLDESKNWSLSVDNVREATKAARKVRRRVRVCMRAEKGMGAHLRASCVSGKGGGEAKWRGG